MTYGSKISSFPQFPDILGDFHVQLVNKVSLLKISDLRRSHHLRLINILCNSLLFVTVETVSAKTHRKDRRIGDINKTYLFLVE